MVVRPRSALSRRPGALGADRCGAGCLGTADFVAAEVRRASFFSETGVAVRPGPAQLFYGGPPGLGLQTPLLGGGGGSGRPSWSWRAGRAADQRDQPLTRV